MTDADPPARATAGQELRVVGALDYPAVAVPQPGPTVPRPVAAQPDPTPARPTVRLIADHAKSQLIEQVSTMRDYDTKGNFLAVGGAGTAVATSTLLTGHGHLDEHIQDLGILSVAAAVLALVVIVLGVWRPRPADVPPDPFALRRDFWNHAEEDVLLAIVDTQADAFQMNKSVISAKLTSLKVSAYLVAAAIGLLAVTAIAIALRT